jgi:N-acetyl-anhydromuramyl-L-alanine amidase AmpD
MEPTDIKYIVIHCSATRASGDIGFKEINQWHISRGWSGCGYHFIVKRDGTLEVGRDQDKVGAHTKGHNRVSWGICLVGGLDEEGNPENNFTSSQLNTLRLIIGGLKNIAPSAEVLGHRDLSPDIDGDGVIEPHEWVKACPCFDVRAWFESVA